MSLMEWPMTSYPYLSRWYAQLQKRPSFQQAVVDCEPPGDRAMFASYVAQRRSEGTSVADMLSMSAALIFIKDCRAHCYGPPLYAMAFALLRARASVAKKSGKHTL
jgi:hypothetical protein